MTTGKILTIQTPVISHSFNKTRHKTTLQQARRHEIQKYIIQGHLQASTHGCSLRPKTLGGEGRGTYIRDKFIRISDLTKVINKTVLNLQPEYSLLEAQWKHLIVGTTSSS